MIVNVVFIAGIIALLLATVLLCLGIAEPTNTKAAGAALLVFALPALGWIYTQADAALNAMYAIR